MDARRIREQFNACAETYDSRRKLFIPCYDDFYKTAVSLLKVYRNRFSHVVDLGAGTGLLAKEVYEQYPEARYTLIDISEDMLDIARERFAGLDNVEFLAGDYTADIPPGSDLICSGLSIHHLEDGEKEFLYKAVYGKLEKNGCFINCDQFRAEPETVERLYGEWWRRFVDRGDLPAEEKAVWSERRKLDRENTVPETVNLLKAAGFETVECVYSFMKFAVILAIK